MTAEGRKAIGDYARSDAAVIMSPGAATALATRSTPSTNPRSLPDEDRNNHFLIWSVRTRPAPQDANGIPCPSSQRQRPDCEPQMDAYRRPTFMTRWASPEQARGLSNIEPSNWRPKMALQ